MIRMKSFSSVLIFFLFSHICGAQNLTQPTLGTYVLPNFQGQLIQYSFITDTGSWSGTKQSKKYIWDTGTNVLEIQTVGGASLLYAEFTGPVCKNGCTYNGAFTRLNQELVTSNGVSFVRVSGDLLGTFTDLYGINYTNVVARFSTETYPASDGVLVPGPGGLIVVLEYN
jgi:hypothetical protein